MKNVWIDVSLRRVAHIRQTMHQFLCSVFSDLFVLINCHDWSLVSLLLLLLVLLLEDSRV
ncbi:unnamed protein product [Anisakis simplex]|uniref:Uncharacterized protein n=1 Tax=Anisakis simplex TaxID=6269 RepID=A0A3P6PSZ8_ANISI|nr:unnamed protein product [Anisakis simplex]